MVLWNNKIKRSITLGLTTCLCDTVCTLWRFKVKWQSSCRDGSDDTRASQQHVWKKRQGWRRLQGGRSCLSQGPLVLRGNGGLLVESWSSLGRRALGLLLYGRCKNGLEISCLNDLCFCKSDTANAMNHDFARLPLAEIHCLCIEYPVPSSAFNKVSYHFVA